MSDQATGDGADLQFDRAVPRDGVHAGGAVACHWCHRTIQAQYYDVSGQAACVDCHRQIQALTESPVGAAPLLKAGLFGGVAGIAGAIVYYAVVALTHFEIGIVAILIGYMVGYAVRKGAGGRGGRRFQVLAIALTYTAVALAYAPIEVRALLKDRAERNALLPAEDPAQKPAARPMGIVKALAILAVALAVLPVVVVVGGLPASLISGLIIFFGLKQAWRMTGVPALAITGPYRVGVPPPAAPA